MLCCSTISSFNTQPLVLSIVHPVIIVLCQMLLCLSDMWESLYHPESIFLMSVSISLKIRGWTTDLRNSWSTVALVIELFIRYQPLRSILWYTNVYTTCLYDVFCDTLMFILAISMAPYGDQDKVLWTKLQWSYLKCLGFFFWCKSQSMSLIGTKNFWSCWFVCVWSDG